MLQTRRYKFEGINTYKAERTLGFLVKCVGCTAYLLDLEVDDSQADRVDSYMKYMGFSFVEADPQSPIP